MVRIFQGFRDKIFADANCHFHDNNLNNFIVMVVLQKQEKSGGHEQQLVSLSCNILAFLLYGLYGLYGLPYHNILVFQNM